MITVKQAARVMNVSERLVYMARRIRHEAPDLAPAIEAGHLSLHAATRQLDARQGRTQTMQRVWHRATTAEREAFLRWLEAPP